MNSDDTTATSNQSSEPTPVGRFNLQFDILIPTWLSFGR
jgi:hypothetical protein